MGSFGPAAIGLLIGSLVSVSTIAGTIERKSVVDITITCTYFAALPKIRWAYIPIGKSTKIMIAVKCPAVKCPVFMIGKPVTQVIMVSKIYVLPGPVAGSSLPER